MMDNTITGNKYTIIKEDVSPERGTGNGLGGLIVLQICGKFEIDFSILI
jgi:hypothetical protein